MHDHRKLSNHQPWHGTAEDQPNVHGLASPVCPCFCGDGGLCAGYVDGEKFYRSGVNPWINFCEYLLAGWSLFIFPLYVSLLSALYASIEHQNRAWGYVYSLPVPKSSIYLSKLFVLTTLIALSHVLLVVFGPAAGWLMGWLKPAYGFQDFAMPAFMPIACMNLFVCGLGVVVIQLLISLWYPSFIIPAGLGLFATLASAIVRSFSMSHFSPYLWPYVFLNNRLQMTDWDHSTLVWSVIVYVLGQLSAFSCLAEEAMGNKFPLSWRFIELRIAKWV